MHLLVPVPVLHHPPTELGYGESCGEGELQVGAAGFVVTPSQVFASRAYALLAGLFPPG